VKEKSSFVFFFYSLKNKINENCDYQEGLKLPTKRTLIIMDEVDGISSGDRGGAQEVIRIIRNTKVYIVIVVAINKPKNHTDFCVYSLPSPFPVEGSNNLYL